MRYTNNKDTDKFLEELRCLGCSLVEGRKQIRVIDPWGRQLTVVSKGSSAMYYASRANRAMIRNLKWRLSRS